MNFFKGIRFFALVGLIVFGVGTYMFLRGRPPTEPVQIYKATQPSAKPELSATDTATKQPPIPHDHSHEHPHDHEAHEHAAVPTPKPDKYDWRDDSTVETLSPKSDPWNRTDLKEELTDADDTYPPRNWHETADPVLRAEYYGVQMLKQFGDTPEVRTVSDWELRKAMGITPTHDELVTYLESLYHLFPRESTLEALKYHRNLKDKGVEVRMIPERGPR